MPRSPEFFPVHRHGECDTCHGNFELFAFEDDEPGDWEYCKRDAEIISRNRKWRLVESRNA